MPSVAPITIIGTAVTPGHILVVSARTALMTSSRIGEAGPDRGLPSTTTLTAVSLMMRRSVWVT